MTTIETRGRATSPPVVGAVAPPRRGEPVRAPGSTGARLARPNQGRGTVLLHYEAMRAEIAACHKMDEIRQIRDKAIALQLYARQAKDTGLEKQVREIRVRAERRAGQLLAVTPRAKGGRRPRDKTRKQAGAPTLKDVGIAPNESSTWQRLAAMPEADFERDLAAVAMPTGARVIAAHRSRQNPAREPPPEPPPAALLLVSFLARFEAKGLLAADPAGLLAGLPGDLAALVRELAPKVSAWLVRLTAAEPQAPTEAPAEPVGETHPPAADDGPAAAGWRLPGIRRCLRCGRQFSSAHAGNRLCGDCVKRLD